MHLDELPGELFDTILSHLPASDSQYTTYSLIRALPDSPIHITHLYRCIRLTQPTQAIKFYKHLRLLKTSNFYDDEKTLDRPVLLRSAGVRNPLDWITELSIESWTVDPDIVINIIQMLPGLQSLNLWIGPNNFSPEHLEDLFSKPMSNLWYLGLRFRPYVQQANYYQFLKGAYFDSALTKLSCWPSSNLSVLSLVQDPITRDMIPPEQRTFAQPLVFFKLELCLSTLMSSPAAASLSHLQVRIPSRPINRALCNPPVQNPFPNFKMQSHPPDIHYLDISTCALLETEVDNILATYSSVKHLVLDKCEPATGDLALDGRWNAFGKRCALIGVKRAKEREKTLKAWYDSFGAGGAGMSSSTTAPQQSRPTKVKKGRKGLAISTISLRDREAPAMRSESSAAQGAKSEERQKIRILPCLPTLHSISIVYKKTPDKLEMMRREFESGWAEGIAQLSATRGMRRTSANNGIRIMRIKSLASQNEDDDDYEHDYYARGEGMHDLEDVDALDVEAFGVLSLEPGPSCYDAPVLCFLSTDTKLDNHPQNCPHRMGTMFISTSTS